MVLVSATMMAVHTLTRQMRKSRIYFQRPRPDGPPRQQTAGVAYRVAAGVFLNLHNRDTESCNNSRARHEARARSATGDPYHSSSTVSYASPSSRPTPNGYEYAVIAPNNITARHISAKTLASRTRTLN